MFRIIQKKTYIGRSKMELKNLSLEKIKVAVEKMFEERGKNVVVNIHVSTEMPEQKKGAVLSQQNRYDIMIAGDVKFGDLLSVIAHEVAHIVAGFKHGQEFDKEKEKIEKELKRKLDIS